MIGRCLDFRESSRTKFSLWRRIKCFSSTLHERNLAQQSPVILDLYSRKTRLGKSRDYRDVSVVKKLRFVNVFRQHESANPAFSNSSGFKSTFRKTALSWRICVDSRPKLNFKISPGVVWAGPNFSRERNNQSHSKDPCKGTSSV